MILLKKRKKDWLRKLNEESKKDVNLLKKQGAKTKKETLKMLKMKRKLRKRLNVLNKEIAAIKEKKKKQPKMSATILK